ncbi:MAG: hypothetical protein JRH20_24775 [Deltaproteobacteria bacterium]|nr:hypothetical protein [Deltaproteobacteria bacterium]
MTKTILAKLADKKGGTSDGAAPSRLGSAASAAYKAMKAGDETAFSKAFSAAMKIAVAESK